MECGIIWLSDDQRSRMPMSISQELYNRLSETIRPLVRVSNSKQITNWLWIVVGLVLGMVFGDRWQVFRVSLQHGCRAIPLIWIVVDGKGVISVERLAERLGRV